MAGPFIIYGIRLRGDTEVRYVGLTTQTLRKRHFNHRSDHSSPVYRWIIDNGDDAETFAITHCETRAEACATEKLIISACLAMNHRLFNRDGVPSHMRRDRFLSTGLPNSIPCHIGTPNP